MDTPNARICIHHRQQRHAPAAAQIRRLYARPYSRWLTTFCDQWQTQMRVQRLAERQALADGDQLRVIADCGLEAQPHSAASRRRCHGFASRAAVVQRSR
jgi:hypothetical protein